MTGIEKTVLLAILGVCSAAALGGLYFFYRNGWDQLARCYRADANEFPTPLVWGPFYSHVPRVGIHRGPWTHKLYIRMAADQSGLYLISRFPQRLIHPPLFIPWSDVTDTWQETKLIGFTVRAIQLKFRKVDDVRITLSEEIVKALKERSANRWNTTTV